MTGQTIKIRASGGGEFDCYVIVPKTDKPVPAIVLASAIHGVDPDIHELADEFAAKGFIAAAPDLFWRSVPGPLAREDERAAKRSQPRLEKIKAGEQDLKDTLAHLRTLPQFNGNAAVMGFCYGGPYAILGPKRLGYAAGISCHGTQLQDYIKELDGVQRAGLHHLGRPRSRRAGAGAGSLPRRARTHEERRGAYFPRHPARLHDAQRGPGVRPEDAGFLHGARDCDP